ncbi:MAG: hypothetical protein HW413_737 [Thermoleophilia bacterium]|nr:hypothetical protein [Thermoleophilia bacterium]
MRAGEERGRARRCHGKEPRACASAATEEALADGLVLRYGAVKLVLTLVVRDEADVIDANVAFHLNAGVDFVIALDNGSHDGTVDVLDAYSREGWLHLIRDPSGNIGRGESQTMLARLAAADFEADWVITADADQFYWPRGGSLREILVAIPDRFGILTAPRRVFAPRPDGKGSFAERMTARVSTPAPINDPASPFRPQSNVIHRAHTGVVVAPGNRGVWGVPYAALRGWSPIEVLHFPLRSMEQCERKYIAANRRWLRNAVRAKANAMHDVGRFREYYEGLIVDDSALERGLADGSLAIDTRLRDALRTLWLEGGGARVLPRFALPSPRWSGLSFPSPSLTDEAEYALDLSVIDAADAVRNQRRIDELERRVGLLERRIVPSFLGGVHRRAASSKPR